MPWRLGWSGLPADRQPLTPYTGHGVSQGARQADGLHALLLCFTGRAGEACPSGRSGCNRRSRIRPFEPPPHRIYLSRDRRDSRSARGCSSTWVRQSPGASGTPIAGIASAVGRCRDAGRIHRQVAGLRVEGKLGGAGALHRPVPSARRADPRRGRPHGRALLLRTRRPQGYRRQRLGGCVEKGLLRLGIQGQARRPRRGFQPATAIRPGAGKPAAPDRLRHGAVPHPHQLDQQRERDARVRAGRPRRRRHSRQAEMGDVRPGMAAARRDAPDGDRACGSHLRGARAVAQGARP